MTTTRTGTKLHRLSADLEKLPTAGLIALAKASKRLVEAEARAAGVGTMRLSGRARGPRQEGPTRPRRTVRLRARDTLTEGQPSSTLRIQAVPVGPWVWANTGADAHWVGRAKGRRLGGGRAGPTRLQGAWVNGARYRHGVRGPILHPGTGGRGAWRDAADKVVKVAPIAFTDKLADIVSRF